MNPNRLTVDGGNFTDEFRFTDNPSKPIGVAFFIVINMSSEPKYTENAMTDQPRTAVKDDQIPNSNRFSI